MRTLFVLLTALSSLISADFPITCLGHTTLRYKGPQKEYIMDTKSPIYVDITNNTLHCSRTEAFNEPIYFHNENKEIYASNLELTYKKDKGSLLLNKVHLFGDVYLEHQKEDGSFEYATADTLDYLTDQKKIVLSSNSSSKVLYVDTNSDTKIAAEQVIIDQNSETSKWRMQSLGRAHLESSAKEFDTLIDHIKNLERTR